MIEVAEMLGVKLGEEFKIKDCNKTFKISKDGMEWCYELPDDCSIWISANDILSGILIGDNEIVKKPILTQQEKEYLKTFIEPFRNRVKTIIKVDLNHEGVYEFIRIDHDDYSSVLGTINLPNFKKGTMFKGMRADKEYTLEDLGL